MAESVFFILGVILAYFIVSYMHKHKSDYLYCKEHKNLRLMNEDKFCPVCVKPLYKKVIKDEKVK